MTDRFRVVDCGLLGQYIRDNGNIITVDEVCEILNKLHNENQQYTILVNSLKEQNQKLKLRLKDLGVEYY